MRPDALLRSWVEIGYQPADIVVEAGQFSRRGGILDIWPPAEPYPVRLEFFGDEIDTLRRFDPATQRTLKKLEQLLVTPAREVLPGKAEGLDLPGQDVDEFYLPLVHPSPASLLDYLPRDALVLVDDLDRLQVAANEIEEQAVRLRQESIPEGTLAANFPVPYLTWSELQDSLSGHTWLELGRSTASGNFSIGSAVLAGPALWRPLEAVDGLYGCGMQTGATAWLMVSRQVSRLRELWDEQPTECAAEAGAPEFHEGTLSEGWILTLDNGRHLHLLTDSEIFGWERPQPRQRHRPVAEAPEAAYADLKPGDWVVHMDYGIGRYVGLVQRAPWKAPSANSCWWNTMAATSCLCRSTRPTGLSRYIGPDGEPPSPTRLGRQRMGADKAAGARGGAGGGPGAAGAVRPAPGGTGLCL